ncbi:sensor histidine kinase [Streptomyces natalensis]|uniref:sensor histidine kinase n=1 Tax=Streptomyces natalensis TaxID=68242 RepID=UPI00068DB869|nr:HAMP domain-containing sensor histidine kinase [Streptomyces natalensis]
MNRIPLRIRLTAIFAAVMALVLVGAGYLTLSRFRESQSEYGTATGIAHQAQQAALDDLLRELLTALPIVFVLATLGAYLLAAAALRPVERMRTQAAAVTEDTPDDRLDVPPSRDEIARLAATLNDMLTRLQTALDHERLFVADASHELRTPLSLLRTEIELALRRPRDAAELHAALVSAHEETERLVQLAEDLLLLARTDRRETSPAGVTVPDLARLLQRVAARLRNGDPGKAVTIGCPAGLTAAVPHDRLERAVTNLIHNAQQHGRGPVEATARPDGDQVRIEVRDHGPGFPPAFLPHAFDRFTQADRSRATSGTGLGLAITAATARAAGGEYGAFNHPDGGAVVWITLPTLPHPPHAA